jgi:UDP-glucose 4-epimerase
VGDSWKNPIDYFINNISASLNVLDLCKKYSIDKFIFSSSANVYGVDAEVPIVEDSNLDPSNPYGQSKLILEKILLNLFISESVNISNNWKIILLRYFNPIGAHESGLIGEKVPNIPSNIMPYILKVASGELECLNIYGDDYETKDGTGVRDYIHIMDLAQGHLAALNRVIEIPDHETYFKPINLGTGNGYSVYELLMNFIKYTGIDIPYKIDNKRPGDIPESYADVTCAKKELKWSATRNLKDMVLDSWNRQQKINKL